MSLVVSVLSCFSIVVSLNKCSLDYVLRRDPQFLGDIDKNILMRGVERLGETAVDIIYTPVDTVALLDKVLLHEV